MKRLFLTILLLASLYLPGAEKETFHFPLSTFHFPWVGGLNACQFGRMDLDGDGMKDLLVFDRHDNRLLCFLNRGERGALDYQYTSIYDGAFPELSDWVVFADYDGDGREDLFTYSPGWAGIMVYRNVSATGHPAFHQVVAPYLTSFQGGGEVNILATNADYPALTDLDGDGDLDLLTFGVLGTFIEHHRNLSMERYGTRDSLVYERVDLCWGRVGESEENNVMYLDTCLFGYGLKVDPVRHRGATVTVRDLNGDALPDLLLADVDYPGLTLLMNGGDAEKALMVSQTEAFPQQCPVRLPSMPVPFFTDVNNDGVDDLLVSPFDPDPMACKGKESVWLYLNHGTNEIPDFQIYTKSFLQNGMIDLGTGATPVVVDWDGDGLLDVVLGTIGDIENDWGQDGVVETSRKAELSWLRNVGNATEPAFVLQSFPVKTDCAMGLSPAFFDFDNDGLPELLVGTAEGRLRLFAHDGSLLEDDFLHYDKPWSAPCLFDVDQDGWTDLVVGNATGKLSFYRGSGASAPEEAFHWVTDEWGGVDVRDYHTSYYGYSVPTLFSSDEKVWLAVGSESGKLFLFEGLAADGQTVFEEVSDRWPEICEDVPQRVGTRASVAVADLNGDGILEMMAGSFAGGLRLINADIPVVNLAISEFQEDEEVLIFPNPVQSQIHIITKGEGIKTVMVMDAFGRKRLERAVSSKEPVLEVQDLPPGVYLLGLAFDFGLVNRIFLKR